MQSRLVPERRKAEDAIHGGRRPADRIATVNDKLALLEQVSRGIEAQGRALREIADAQP